MAKLLAKRQANHIREVIPNLLQVTNQGDGLENKSFDILLEFKIDGESEAVALILLKSLEDCDAFDVFANVEWGNGCVPSTQEDSPSLVR